MAVWWLSVRAILVAVWWLPVRAILVTVWWLPCQGQLGGRLVAVCQGHIGGRLVAVCQGHIGDRLVAGLSGPAGCCNPWFSPFRCCFGMQLSAFCQLGSRPQGRIRLTICRASLCTLAGCLSQGLDPRRCGPIDVLGGCDLGVGFGGVFGGSIFGGCFAGSY